MKNTNRLVILLAAVIGAALWAGPAAAADPVLEIHQAGGGIAIYPLGDIQRILFVGDSLEVTSGAGADRYALASIETVLFPSPTTGVANPEVVEVLPKLAALFPNRPNPFNPETHIAFRLDEPGPVELKVYAVSGRVVRTLVDGTRDAGLHDVAWDGRDDSGRRVAAGVYFYRLTTPALQESRRMTLIP